MHLCTFRVCVAIHPVKAAPLQHRGDLIQMAKTSFGLVYCDEGDLVITSLQKRIKDIVDLCGKTAIRNERNGNGEVWHSCGAGPHIDPDIAALLVDDEGMDCVSNALQSF